MIVSYEVYRNGSIGEFSLGWENRPALGSSDEVSLKGGIMKILMVHSNLIPFYSY